MKKAKKENILSESEEAFVQQIRGMRNRYKYEGFYVSKEYIERNEERILKIIDKLFSLTDSLS